MSTLISITRSIRLSFMPQFRAMSVALDAQGDTVPKRGVTTNKAPCSETSGCT